MTYEPIDNLIFIHEGKITREKATRVLKDVYCRTAIQLRDDHYYMDIIPVDREDLEIMMYSGTGGIAFCGKITRYEVSAKIGALHIGGFFINYSD